MSKQTVRKQTTHRTTSQEAQIRKAIAKFETQQRAALTEAARLRDAVSRAVGGLPESSLHALSDVLGRLSMVSLVGDPISTARDLLRQRLPAEPKPAPLLTYPPAIAQQLIQAAPRLVALVKELKALRGTRFHSLVSELEGEVDDLYEQLQHRSGPAVSELLHLSSNLGSLLEGMEELEGITAKVFRRVGPPDQDEGLQGKREGMTADRREESHTPPAA